MADIVDTAQDYIVDYNQQVLTDLSLKLKEQQAKPSLYECLDCGDPIPELRRQLGNIQFCTECQVFH